MRKLLFRKIISWVAMLFIAAHLSGCSMMNDNTSQKQTPLWIAIIIGNHANSQQLNLNSTTVTRLIGQAAGSYGSAAVIVADGQPDLRCLQTFDIPDQYKQADEIKLRSDAGNRAAAMIASIQNFRAEDPEVDVLESLWQAVRSLSSAPDGSERVICVLDTGLSTAGLLDFRNNLLNADPDEIAALLDQKQAIPDFSGITVIWQHLGDVSSPQNRLAHAQVEQLKTIWTAILEKTGAAVEFSNDVPVSSALSNDKYPAVSVVDLPGEVSLAFDPDDDMDFAEPLFIDEKQIKFIGDTADFLDSDAASAVISPVASYMKSHPDFKLLLIGTTAGDANNEFCLNLSESRALAVENLLVSLGVLQENISAIGLGNSDPWHIKDIDPGGSWIDAYAARNRKVVLLDANSPFARDMLDKARPEHG